jgi:dihydropyrimidinase
VSVGADADLVVWDPAGTKTLSAKTQHSKGDYNIFEGRQVKGIPSHTVSQGELVYVQGDLRAVQGKGRYIKRPAFSDNFAANKLRANTLAPTAVKR